MCRYHYLYIIKFWRYDAKLREVMRINYYEPPTRPPSWVNFHPVVDVVEKAAVLEHDNKTKHVFLLFMVNFIDHNSLVHL